MTIREITELKYISLIKMTILEENFKWHLEAFASELFICKSDYLPVYMLYVIMSKTLGLNLHS